MNYSLTILTPLFNRKQFLEALYSSLNAQTRRDFQWLVIDDGSDEGSDAEFAEYAEKSDFLIEYFKKENGGKHTALNYSHKYIKSDWVLILDSDDTLTPDAVETVCGYIEKYGRENDIGILSFLRCDKSGKPLVRYDKDEEISDYIEYRINRNRPGDCCEVVRTDVLKEFPFPEYEGEKLVVESYFWLKSGLKYKTVYIRKPVYICEYLAGGLTDSGMNMRKKSPRGQMDCQIVGLNPRCSLKYRIKRAILLVYYGKFLKMKIGDIAKMSPCPAFVKLFSPFGVAMYCKYR